MPNGREWYVRYNEFDIPAPGADNTTLTDPTVFELLMAVERSMKVLNYGHHVYLEGFNIDADNTRIVPYFGS